MNANPENLIIRSSTAEFLVFTQPDGENGINVRYEDGSVWLTQKLMAELFGTSADNIGLHLKNIYAEGEVEKGATTEDFSVVRKEGSRQVRRTLKYYHLDAIISVGYRVNSKRATQFRQWATKVLATFAVKGYVLDKKRLENGAFLGEDYFEHLLEEIREIRLSERRFYQKITDIYATSVDYDKNAPTTREFFAAVQNKLHYAIHGHTASELVRRRADSAKPNMGLSHWEGAPAGKILKTDVAVAKNYLTAEELKSLARIVSAYLDLAEDRAQRRIPMTMDDWAERLDKFLAADDRELLQDAGSVTQEIAQEHAERKFQKYRVIQDRRFESDFDKDVKAIENPAGADGGGEETDN